MEYLFPFVATFAIGMALIDRVIMRLERLESGKNPTFEILAFLCGMFLLLDLMLRALP